MTTTPTHHLTVQVPRDLFEELKTRARREDRSVSAVVRRTLTAGLDLGPDARIRDQGEAHIFEEARR